MNVGSNLVTCMMRTDAPKLSSDLYMYVAIHVYVTHNTYKMTLKERKHLPQILLAAHLFLAGSRQRPASYVFSLMP